MNKVRAEAGTDSKLQNKKIKAAKDWKKHVYISLWYQTRQIVATFPYFLTALLNSLLKLTFG
jgi:hypothetical protein